MAFKDQGIEEKGMDQSKKVFRIFTAVFLGIVLLAGLTLGVIAIVRNARAVMVYKGVYLYEGEANYLTASYKQSFMSTLARGGIECKDEESFWQSDAGDGRTYGDILKENTEKYLKSVLIGNYLFDRNAKLTKADKNQIEKSIDEVLVYKAEGNKTRFNEIGATMGFDFRDFKKAAKMIYKAEKAEEVIFGYEGASLASGNFMTECDDYFVNNYSRVNIIIIRTDGKYVTDEETKIPVFKEYTSDERSKVLADIQEIREHIADGSMNEVAFKYWIGVYPTDEVNDAYGYYFSSSSAYSKNFKAQSAPDLKDKSKEIVATSLSMNVGEYAECELNIGTCFIYKSELESRAYTNTVISRFFEDFYANAVPYVYQNSIETYMPDVKVKKKYNPTAVIYQKYNELTISFY